MDETGMYYRALPDRSLVVRGADCHGGKHSKERLTAVLTCNMTGEFTKTWIIGKSENPRCFKNLDKKTLPVVYKYNRKAWMTSPLYTEHILDLDRQMRLQNRKILLFEDNAPSHVKDIELTNIKVVFYPPNTTSRLQPLDQGIIKNLKAFYRKKLLEKVVSAINEAEFPDACSVARKVDVLDCCMWIA
ncbi:LOW QUALITY PROTEIN: tigger transposable element-derived protein 6-like [Nematostella vectensis]|uniref:LOW QUALITY PROTEIN: tigger transposable element-derived protein 6-like n=1 Tax=Nematostella vectensis TaxID=45351 RepID=UPI002077186D|nr:LOW QUALITY PROTEIN: tigger transposable element-derived protein 6-like [Nematostella vectensis]